MARARKYRKDLIDRGVRLALESRPIAHIAADLGINSEVLRMRVRQAEADAGVRTDLLTTQEREEIRARTLRPKAGTVALNVPIIVDALPRAQRDGALRLGAGAASSPVNSEGRLGSTYRARRSRFRKPLLYPLSYGGAVRSA